MQGKKIYCMSCYYFDVFLFKIYIVLGRIIAPKMSES